MNLLYLPDICGMLIMMGVLLWLRREYRDARVDLWMIGLTFILIEAIASAVFRSRSLTHATHAIALDAYVLAGVAFGWAARKDMMHGSRRVPLSILPATPLFLMSTMYAYDVKGTFPYLLVSLVSLAAGVAYMLIRVRASVRFRLSLLGIHLGIWLPAVYFAQHTQLRWLIYWGLACLYLLVALSFRGLVRRDRIGGLVIVAGFVVWSICFLFHPLARTNVMWNGVLEQLWNSQKFIVILGMLLVLLEEQTRRRQEEAMHDPLTALPNRRLFDDRLAQSLERARRTGISTALFVLDLNGFKEVNDTHGHMMGDMVLMQAADALRTKVRGSDTLARCGGDEFFIIVNDLARREDCERIVEALRIAVEGVRMPAGSSRLTASIGYALFPEDAPEAASLCEAADKNMYGQKGRKRIMASA